MYRTKWPGFSGAAARTTECSASSGFCSGTFALAVVAIRASARMVLFHAHVTGRLPIGDVDGQPLLAVARSVVRRALDGDYGAFVRFWRYAKSVGGLAVQSLQQNAAVARDADATGGADLADLFTGWFRRLSEGESDRADGE